jgi:hypothetical protein
MSKGLIDSTTIMFLAGVVLIAVLASYSSSKGTESFKQTGGNGSGAHHTAPSAEDKKVWQAADAAPAAKGGGAKKASHAQVQASDPSGSTYSSVQASSSSSIPAIPGCSGTVSDPKDLLPPAGANAFGQPVPPPSGQEGTNFLSAGHHIGIDTVGQSLRNANLQLRSEPPNPQQQVGPWNNATIQPDLMRVPLEIGCGEQ